MQRIIWTLWVLSCTLVLQAQVSTINWNTPLDKKEHKKARHSFLGSTQEHYYLWDKVKSENVILQFDLNHQRVNTIPVNTQKGEKKEYRKIINTTSGNHIIATDYSKKQLSFYTSKIKPDGSTAVEDKLAFTSDTRNVAPFHKDRESGRYFNFTTRSIRDDQVGLFLSPDRAKVVYANTLNKQDADVELGIEKYHVVVLDENLEKLWEREIDFQTKNRKIKIKQVAVSNSGEVYLVGLNYSGKRKPSKGSRRSYDFVIYKITKSGELEQQIKIDGVTPTHIRLSLIEDGGFWLVGLYSEKDVKKALREHGVFLAKYDANNKQVMQKLHQWEDSFFKKLKKGNIKQAESAISKLYDFRLGKVFIDSKNQDICFLTDYIYMKKSNTNRNGTTSVANTSSSSHILVSAFDRNGEYKHTAIIDRLDFFSCRGQIAEMDYFSIQKDGMLYFIFDDNKTSKELRAMPKFKGKQTAKFIEMAQVDEEGEIKFREIIYNTSEVDGQFTPINTHYLGDGKILIDGGGWRQNRVGVLKLN